MTTNKQDVRTELRSAVSAGEHDTPDSTVFNESELVEWEFDERAVFELFSQKVYPDDEAGLRETLFNAYAAALRAETEYNIEGKVSIRLYSQEDGSLRLVVRDNGVGVNRETLDEAMVYIGRSQNRWVSDVLGKFGVGGLAAFRLIPHNGIFLMHTRSRQSGEEFRGAWWTRGFEIEQGDELPSVFGEGEYGTRFEFPLKEDISRSDVRSWVRQHAQYARVPVEYQEVGFENGENTVYDEVTLGEYRDDAFVMSIETDDFRAFCSPEARGHELMLDSPLSDRQRGRRGRRRGVRQPFQVDIRYKNENGPVIAGPHKGLTPVSEGEYTDLPEQVKDDFMCESELTEEDIRLPFPTGTREKVEHIEEFYEWLRDTFAERYREHVRTAVDKLDEPMDFFELSDAERRVFFTSPNVRDIDVPKVQLRGNRPTGMIRSAHVGVIEDEELQEFFEILRTRVQVTPPIEEPVEYEARQSGYQTRQVFEVAEAHSSEDVYMGISIHEGRRELVAESGGVVVKLPDSSAEGTYDTASDLYEPLSSWFEWNKLKDVTVEYATETFELDESVVSDALSASETDEKDVGDETVNIHFRNESWGHKKKASELLAHFNGEQVYEDNRWSHPPEELVVFTRSMDANLSDNYAFATDSRAVAHCSSDVAEYLCRSPHVKRFDEVSSEVNEPVVYTSGGKLPVSELEEGDILHVASGVEHEAFSQYADELQDNIESLFNSARRFDGDPTYAVIELDGFASASPWLDTDKVRVVGPDRVRSTEQSALSRTRAYAHMRLGDWKETVPFRQLERNLFTEVSFEDGGKAIIDALAVAAENGEFDLESVMGDFR